MGVSLGARLAGAWLRPAAWLRRWRVASLVVNILIVVTGGVVRLTGSGLGCPTWPRCTDESFTPHGAMDIHAAIEFGNRMVTFLIAAVAIATFVAAWRSGRTAIAPARPRARPRRPGAGRRSAAITVLTDLNPWIVALHLLVSLAMICVAVVLRPAGRRAGRPAGPRRAADERRAGWSGCSSRPAGSVLYLGTVVTGSGPHAGDADAPRNGLDPRAVEPAAHRLRLPAARADGRRRARAARGRRARRAPGTRPTLLLVVELAQGVDRVRRSTSPTCRSCWSRCTCSAPP